MADTATSVSVPIHVTDALKRCRTEADTTVDTWHGGRTVK